MHKKGSSDKWLVQQVVKDFDSLGYGRLIFRTDGEPAIVDVQKQVKLLRAQKSNTDTIIDNHPIGHSDSAGVVEKAVQEIEEQVRVMKSHIEAKNWDLALITWTTS